MKTRACECYKKKKVSPVKEQNYEFVALIIPDLDYGMLYPPPPPPPPFPLDMACGLGKLLTIN